MKKKKNKPLQNRMVDISPTIFAKASLVAGRGVGYKAFVLYHFVQQRQLSEVVLIPVNQQH